MSTKSIIIFGFMAMIIVVFATSSYIDLKHEERIDTLEQVNIKMVEIIRLHLVNQHGMPDTHDTTGVSP